MIKNLAIGGGSNRTLLLLALLLGLIAAVLIGVYLSSLEDDESAGPAQTSLVVVAAIEIPPLTEITEEMLTVKSVPADLALVGGFTEIDGVVGETTQVSVVPGEQLLQTKVISPDSAPVVFGDNAPLSLIIPEGMRGFSVAVSAVGAAGGLIRPGDRVDVILSGELDSGAGSEGGEGTEFTAASGCYILQDVEVLALNNSLKKTTSQSDAAGLASASTNAEASRATLAVTPDQAWKLAAVQEGVGGGGVETQLWLSLRPFGDSSVSESLPTCTVLGGSNLVAGS